MVTADDDLSIQLKRFLRPGEPAAAPPRPLRAAPPLDDEPAVAAQTPVPAIDPVLLRSLVTQAVQVELDSLRAQLTSAFDDVLAAVAQQEDHQAKVLASLGAQARAIDAQHQVGQRTLDLLGRTVDEVRQVAAAATAPTPDPSDDVAALAEQVAANQQRLEKGLTIILRDVSRLRDVPVEVDVRSVEDAATRGALQNAADISTLQHHLTTLTEAVRRQDENLGELRATLDWIKERLLLR